jgi:hypothetical protein
MLYLFCTRKLTDPRNGRLTSSLHNILEVAKGDVWSHWTTMNPKNQKPRLAIGAFSYFC